MSNASPFDKERRNIAELLRDWPPTVVDSVIEEMLLLWQAEDLSDKITWRWNSRLRTTIGRAILDDMILELNPLLLGRNPDEMRGVVVHELAHLVITNRFGFKVNPHGAEWKSLMRMAGESTSATHSLDVEGLRARRTRRPRRRRRNRAFPFFVFALLLPLLSCAGAQGKGDDVAAQTTAVEVVGALELRGQVDEGEPGAVLLDDGHGDYWYGEMRKFELCDVSLYPPDGPDGYRISFTVVPGQEQEFSDFTASLVGLKMALLVDGELLTAPLVHERLPATGLISDGPNGMSVEEAEALIARIKGG